MKNPFIILIAIIAVMVLGFAWLVGSGHKYAGKQNTRYSPEFTDNQYVKIKIGMKYDEVIPVSYTHLTLPTKA